MKTHDLPCLTACEKYERNPTSNTMSIKLTEFCSRTSFIAFVAFSSFSFDRRALKLEVLVEYNLAGHI